LPGIPILQVRGNGFVQYSEAMYSSKYSSVRSRSRMLHARKSAYSVGLSDGSRKRLTRAITIMAAACSAKWVKNHKGQMQYFRMAFLTVNLVKKVPTVQAKEMFTKFMTWIRDTKGVRADIWKLEFMVNEIPHFHVLLSDYVHYKECQYKWDEIQREYGVTADRAAEKRTYRTNSIEITHVGKVNDLAGYMIKELSKNLAAKKVALKAQIKEQFPDISDDELKAEVDKQATAMFKIDGKIWDCSLNIRGVPYFNVQLTNAHDKMLQQLAKQGRCRFDVGDFWSIIKLTDCSPPDILSEFENSNYRQHVGQIFGSELPPVPEVEPDAFMIEPDPEKEYTWSQLEMFL